MREIILEAIPNQSFDFETDMVTFNIQLHTITSTLLVSSMSVTSASSGETDVLYTGYPVVAGQPLIPFRSMAPKQGNFYFVTPNDEIPYWEAFGTSHKLFFLNDDEIGELNAIRNST